MRRRLARVALLLLAVALFVGWRADRRTPGRATPPQPDVEVSERVVRRDVRFPCGDATCAAWLYVSKRAAGPLPGVVMGHGFAGTRDVGLAAAAESFAEAGMAALAFDYRHFGASGGLPRQLVDPWSQLEDWRAALRWLAAQPLVDRERIALWGSSLGGGHALIVAADEPVRAVVAQAPLVDSSVEGEATFYGAAWAVRLLLTAWADLAWSALGGDAVAMPAIAPQGRFGMIVDDRAHAAFETLVQPGSSYRNAVAARSILTFDEYDPARQAAGIRVPVLLIASRDDRFAPFSAVERFAAGHADVTVATFPGDHFDVYAPPAADEAIAAAVAFLRAQLGAGSGATVADAGGGG
ncbi:MAG: alpha/beta fold hydrolase [Thermodesulfobacteriota bacterium]